MTNSRVIFCVLLGIIALQGIHGESAADYDDGKGIIDEAIAGILNAAMKVVDGLLDGFSKLADKAHEAIQNIVQKLAARLQVILNSGAKVIENIAGMLGSKIKEAVKLGLINAECATARTKEVSELLLNATNNLAHCTQKVEPVVNEVVSEIKTLLSSLSKLLADSPKQFKACVPVNATLLDLPGIGQCVSKAVRNVVVSAAKFTGQVEHAITQSVRVSEQAVAQVAACGLGTTEEATKESKIILQHLSECVAEHSTTSTAKAVETTPSFISK